MLTEIRRENLRKIITDVGGVSALARKIGSASPSFLSQMTGPKSDRNVSEKTCRDIEQKLGLPHLSMDSPTGSLVAPTQDIMALLKMVAKVCNEEGVDVPPLKFVDLIALTLGAGFDEQKLATVVRLMRP
jgi:hypothetical protein